MDLARHRRLGSRRLISIAVVAAAVTWSPAGVSAQVDPTTALTSPSPSPLLDTGSDPLLDALAYVPPELDLTADVPDGAPSAPGVPAPVSPAGLEFIDWAALKARHGGAEVTGESPLAEREALLGEIARTEAVTFQIDPGDPADWPEDRGWDRSDLEWELRIGPGTTVLRFREGWDPAPFRTRATALVEDYGVTVADDERTVVIERGGSGQDLATQAEARDPLEVAASPFGRVASRLGRPLVARLQRGEDVCSGSGAENALLRGEAARLAASVGRLHRYEVVGAGYEASDPEEGPIARYVFDYARARHATGDQAGRRALLEAGLTSSRSQDDGDANATLAHARTFGRDLVLEVTPEGEGPDRLLDRIAPGPRGEPALLGVCGPPPSADPLIRQPTADVPIFAGPATLALSGRAGIHRWVEARFGADEVRLRASLSAGHDPCALWLTATDQAAPHAPLARPAFTAAPGERSMQSLTLPVDYATASLGVVSTCDSWALHFEPLDDPAIYFTLTERHYPVRGETIAEIASQTDQAKDGWAAYASWATDWRFLWQDDGTSCTVTSGDATLISSIEYPQWRPPAGADPRAVAEWRRFMESLTTHELGHITIALQGADAIDELLDRGLSAPTCAQAERAANRAAKRLHEHYDRLNARYDRETDHGRTQGSTLG